MTPALSTKIRPETTQEEAEAIVKRDYLPPNEQTRIDPAPDLEDDNTIDLLKGHKFALLEQVHCGGDLQSSYNCNRRTVFLDLVRQILCPFVQWPRPL